MDQRAAACRPSWPAGPSVGPPSAGGGVRLVAWLPLTLGQRNEPEPDLTVIPADSISKDRHPGTAILTIEVSGDSLRKDRRVKATVYARFGIAEYWIVNVEARVVEIYSGPDAAKGAYRRTRAVTPAETLASEALPALSFSVAELLG